LGRVVVVTITLRTVVGGATVVVVVLVVVLVVRGIVVVVVVGGGKVVVVIGTVRRVVVVVVGALDPVKPPQLDARIATRTADVTINASAVTPARAFRRRRRTVIDRLTRRGSLGPGGWGGGMELIA
jgi:hypothetical protein